MSSVTENLDSTEGCLYLAVVFSSILWGVGNVQLFFYCEKHWRNDNLGLRLFVLLAWALDTVQQAILLKGIYIYLVTDIGDVEALGAQNVWLGYTPLIAGIVDLQVQLLFVYRAWTLSNRNYYLAGGLLILIFGEFAASVIYFVQLYNIAAATDLSEFIATMKALTSVIVVADTCLAFTLVVLLKERKSGLSRTDSIINRIIAYTVSTGLITSAWSLVGLGTAVALPESYAYIMVLEVMPKLYFNCMMTSLNMRQALHRDMDEKDLEMSGLSSQIATHGTMLHDNFTRTVEVKSEGNFIELQNDDLTASPSSPFKASTFSPDTQARSISHNLHPSRRLSEETSSFTTRSNSRASRV